MTIKAYVCYAVKIYESNPLTPQKNSNGEGVCAPVLDPPLITLPNVLIKI